MNNSAHGTVSRNTEPDGNGLYSGGASVTLTAAPADVPGVTFSHWTVGGVKGDTTGPLAITMNASKTVRAVFLRTVTVNDTGDTAGSESVLTLRYALTHAEDGDTITLPAGQTITLTSPLPDIVKSLTINGNGATLTQSGFTPSGNSQLLRITNNAATVTISRLHFKGGRAMGDGGAINSAGTLTLESCIFSDNEVTGPSSFSSGGAIAVSGAGNILTVLGCTFYNNTAYSCGAIYSNLATVILTGNLFSANTGSNTNLFITSYT